MSQGRKIPFTINLERLFRTPLAFEHEVVFGVARTSQARVVVFSDRYDDPKIIERITKGGIELPDDVLDCLALLCFREMARHMRSRVGESGWWVIDDLTPVLQGKLSDSEASVIERALRLHVKPDVQVMNLMAVDGDDPL